MALLSSPVDLEISALYALQEAMHDSPHSKALPPTAHQTSWAGSLLLQSGSVKIPQSKIRGWLLGKSKRLNRETAALSLPVTHRALSQDRVLTVAEMLRPISPVRQRQILLLSRAQELTAQRVVAHPARRDSSILSSPSQAVEGP